MSWGSAVNICQANPFNVSWNYDIEYEEVEIRADYGVEI